MLNQVFIDDAAGKTIKKVETTFDGTYIIYEDGSFSYFRAIWSHDEAYIDQQSISLAPVRAYKTLPNVPWPAKCIELGIFTQEEYDAALQRAEDEYDAWEHERKQAQLEQLCRELRIPNMYSPA